MVLLDVEMGHYSWYYVGTTGLQSYCLVLNRNIEQQLIHEQMSSGLRLPDYRHTPANITELFAMGLKIYVILVKMITFHLPTQTNYGR